MATKNKSKTNSKSEQELERQYKVLLHNDNRTTQEFVVCVLMSIYEKHETEAERIMLAVHNNGIGIAGVYSKSVAEDKASKTVDVARKSGFPLNCSVEEA